MRGHTYTSKLLFSLAVWATASILGAGQATAASNHATAAEANVLMASSTVPSSAPSRPVANTCPPSAKQSPDIVCGCPPCPPFLILTASPNSLTLVQGKQGSVTITAIGGNIDSGVSLSASGVPSGAKVGFNPNPIPYPTSRTSKMTITAGAKTPPGKYSIHVTGTASGDDGSEATGMTTVTLTVKK